jgi:hypothetical protein
MTETGVEAAAGEDGNLHDWEEVGADVVEVGVLAAIALSEAGVFSAFDVEA